MVYKVEILQIHKHTNTSIYGIASTLSARTVTDITGTSPYSFNR